MSGAAGGLAPSLGQLQALGVTGVTADNLPAIQAAIAATADDGSGVSSLSALQGVVSAAATAAADALGVIKSYADDNTQPAPTVQDYADAGVAGVSSGNLSAINSAIDQLSGAGVDTRGEVQAVVDAYAALLLAADNTDDNDPKPSQAQYAAMGVVGVDSAAKESLLGDVIDVKGSADVETVAQVQALADAVAAVMSGAAGGLAPSLGQLQALGVTGVTADNLTAIQAAIAATADDGSGVSSLRALQGVVSAAATAAADALGVIKSYADDNTQPAPTVQDYADAGVAGVSSGNLSAINSAIDQLSGAGVDTRGEVQAVVDAYAALLLAADNTDDNDPKPSQAQYAAMGVVGVDSAVKESLLGDVIDVKGSADVETVAQVQALADAVAAVMSGAAGGLAPSLGQLQALGVTGVTADNLPAIQAAIAATADDGSGVSSLSALQGVVSAAATAAADALGVIKSYADDNTQPAPTVQDYADAGVAGVSSGNLSAINSAIDQLSGAGVDTRGEVQAVVDAYAALLLAADNTDDNDPKPSQAQYAAIGVVGVDSAVKESLLGDVIDVKGSADVETVAQVQALADAVAAVMSGAAGGLAPSLGQLQALGVTGVTADNLPAIQAAIAATADDGSGVSSLSALQGVVSAAATAAADALGVIKSYADDNTQPAPTVQDYADAGVAGVSSGNLSAINSAIDQLSGAGVDTRGEVQAVVDAYAALLLAADNTDDNDPKPSQAQYAAIGVVGVDSAVKESLLGDVIDVKGSADVETVAQVQALADAVAAVMSGAAGGLAPSLGQLQALGVTGVPADNLPAIQAAIAATADDGSGVSSLSALQGVVSAAATAAADALGVIKSYADDNTQPAPTVQDYADAGVAGVSSGNLSAINSAIDQLSGAGVDTRGEVQAVVDAYAALLLAADNTDDNDPKPSQAQYAAIGVVGVDSAVKESLLGDVIDVKGSADVETVAQVQALADAVAAVMSGAAGGLAPSLGQLQALGVTGVTADNLPAIQAAIAATADDGSGVSSLSALQGVVSAAATAAADALGVIKSYADDNTQPAPTVPDYADAGVAGVSSGNLSAINSAIDQLSGAGVDTRGEVQAVVDAYAALLLAADNTDDNDPKPSQAQYAAIGVVGVDSVVKESLLGDVIDVKGSADVETVAQVQALADVVAAVISGSAGRLAPSLGQLQALGVTGVTADNLPAIQAAIAATADDGSGVSSLSALQGVVSAAATAAADALGVIKSYADDNTQPAPTVQDYADAGVAGVSSGNLSAINSAIDQLSGAGVDTRGEVQAVVDAYAALLLAADNTDDNDPKPSQAQYAAMGVVGVDSAAKESLLGDVIDVKGSADVETVAQVQALADVVAAVMSGAAGGLAPSLGQLQALGVTGVTADNLPAIQAAIAATADDGSGVSSLSALQGVVSAAATAAADALGVIKSYADDNTQPAPTVQDYADAGVAGVSSGNLSAINSAIDQLSGAGVDTRGEVQAVV